MANTQSHNIRIPDELWDAIVAEAEAEDRAPSYIVRRILATHVGAEAKPASVTKVRPARKRVSA